MAVGPGEIGDLDLHPGIILLEILYNSLHHRPGVHIRPELPETDSLGFILISRATEPEDGKNCAKPPHAQILAQAKSLCQEHLNLIRSFNLLGLTVIRYAPRIVTI